MLKYFTGSFWFTGIALALSVVVGEYYGGNAMAVSYLISCLLLGILEVCVSLDNAVVNATVLKDMDDKWRHRFLTWGMLIAVFGMRLVFPIAIVSVAGGINSVVHWSALFSGDFTSASLFQGTALHLALFDPAQYETVLKSVHMQVMAFGGTFLMLVFTNHFINKEKDEHWIPVIGHALAKIGKHGTAANVIPLVFILAFSSLVEDKSGFLISAFWGFATYLAVAGLGDLFDAETNVVGAVTRAGLGAFVYLEVVDASFSFDGVIAAFAITNNFIIIMLGLSIGAMFVRSLTIMLVEHGTLDAYRYLEDGAFWGIGWLVATMFMSTLHIELGEMVVAGGAALAIALSVIHSIWANKQDAKTPLPA